MLSGINNNILPPINTFEKKIRRPLSNITNNNKIIRSNFKYESKYVKNNARYVSEYRNVDDIDYEDRCEPLMACQYVNEIYDYYKKEEIRFNIDYNYMSHQPKISSKMREILIDWLVDVHLKFNMQSETLFLTVNYIDRFLEKCAVARNRLQLVGVTCLLLAAKYEEMMFPEIKDFVYITDNAYTREEILRMENVIIDHLKFDLTVPTIFRFLSRYLKADKAEESHKLCAEYLAERTLQNYIMLQFKPSIIASACVYLSNKLMRNDICWTNCLKKYTAYNEDVIMPCVNAIANMFIQRNDLEAVKRKFSHSCYSNVSKYVEDNISLLFK